MFSCMHIAPGQEQTTPWWQSLGINREPRSLWPFVANFKTALNSDFIIFFFYFIHIYSPGARADKTLGSKFLSQQKALTTSTICYKFKKKIPLNSNFIHIFNVFPHVCSPGARGRQPFVDKILMSNRKTLSMPICCKCQKISFEAWFYTYLCQFSYMYIASGQGQTTPWGQNFCHSGHMLCFFHWMTF